MMLSFRFEKLIADRVVRWAATVACVRCGETVIVTRGELNAVVRVDREFLGIVCPRCLSPQSRTELANLRGEETGRP